ncbi:MAG: DUF480 domain-containing protein [Wenzhouxiangellaceae bacterium]|nr:DUF480 domain-containing protein [Wenzhouxiangellaceae bacterium]MBS3747717.1 DUF480 domain-containing protein [Wenzhouxiangellaceae bacterium]MBS3824250.1 DUF480 domain-containing protein [Wenzhouxiangellaceae bacterium]
MNEITDEEHPGETDLPLDPPLSAEQARVLGCLIEKEGTTPENYPLTQNATVTAANQKTSRNPVMKLDPGRVGQALRTLDQRGLVDSEYGARAARYYHRVDSALKLTAAQRVLIGLLLLRGPQTLAELYTRSERMHRFDDLDDVEHNLERMAAREAPLVVRLPRGPGQREDRYMHRLCGPVDATPPEPRPATAATEAEESNLARRVAELEERVAALERKMEG